MSADSFEVSKEKVAWEYDRDAEGKYRCDYCERTARYVATLTTFEHYDDGMPSLVQHLSDDVCEDHLETFHPDVEIVGRRFE
jgi:hypothetical protein